MLENVPECCIAPTVLWKVFIPSPIAARPTSQNCKWMIPYSSGFQPGFPGTLGFRQPGPGVPPEVIKMLRSTVYCNSPMQLYKQGFLKPEGKILGVPLHQKRWKLLSYSVATGNHLLIKVWDHAEINFRSLVSQQACKYLYLLFDVG